MDVDAGRGVKRGAENSEGSGEGSGADMLREILSSVKNTEVQIGRVQRDVNEAKELAARSLTQSIETKQQMEGLKNRIEKLEKGEGVFE